MYAPDLHGQGDADKSLDGYSLAEQAQDAAAVLDALDVPTASVLGSSSGGYIAQQPALEHPDRVAALVLVGTPLTLRGRPGFADDVDGLTDPDAEDWGHGFLASFPLIQEVRPWFIEDRVHDGVNMSSHAWKLSLRSLYTATPPTDSGTHLRSHADPAGRWPAAHAATRTPWPPALEARN